MLNLVTTADVAVSADVAVPDRERNRMGTSLLWDSALAGPRYSASEKAVVTKAAVKAAVAGPRPQAGTEFALLGISSHVARQAKSASQQPTSNQYAHTMTRIAAFGGGALGPHPARDPV